jgi:elongation factor 1-beta
MVEFKNLQTELGLKSLNTHLLTRSYINGFAPSKTDAEIVQKVAANVDSKKFPHVVRWYRHISSFEQSVRASWGDVKDESAAAQEDEDEDEDFSMSLDDDDEEDDGGAAAAIIAKKNAERASQKNQAKPGEQAKSSVVIDVKPEDSETDMAELERLVRTIEIEGLLWGAAELVPVAFGIKKLRIMAVVVDDLVGVDDLQESIEELEGVQSTDIMSFQKI